MSVHVVVNIRKTIEIDDELFLYAARKEYAETKAALKECGKRVEGCL